MGDIWFQKSSYNNQPIHLLINWLVSMWSKFWNWAVFVKIIDRKIKRFFAMEFFFHYVLILFRIEIVLNSNLCKKQNLRKLWFFVLFKATNSPTNKCMLKDNNRNTRKRCETCSNLTIKMTSMSSLCCLYCQL